MSKTQINKPRLFFDTNILEPLLSLFGESSIRKLFRSIHDQYAYVTSPLTVTELMDGIQNGDPQYFGKDKRKADLLLPFSYTRVLALPKGFILKSVLNREIKESRRFKIALDWTLRALTRDELQAFDVPERSTSKTGGADLKRFSNDILLGKQEHIDIYNNLRQGELFRPDAREWVVESFRPDSFTPLDTGKMVVALDAAYRMNIYLCDNAKNSSYKFEKRSSDWIDIQQLFYLADPLMRMVTNDTDFHRRIGDCEAAERIFTLDHLLQSLG